MHTAPRLIALVAIFLLGCANSPQKPASSAAEGADSVPGQATPADMQLELGTSQAGGKPGDMLAMLSEELDRTMTGLAEQEHPPYHLSYQVTENRTRSIRASFGAIQSDNTSRQRYLDVDVRVGSQELDNTHELRGEWWGDYNRSSAIPFPLDDSHAARNILWRTTDHLYANAIERYIKVVGNHGVKVRESDRSGDFSSTERISHIEPIQSLQGDAKQWKQRVRELSAIFSNHPIIESSSVGFREDVEIRFQVTSDGSKVRKVRHVVYLSWTASTTADDGMDLFLYDSAEAFEIDDLPDDEQLEERVAAMAKKLEALREAPKAQPYVGPAIVEGAAAGVLFHEALGHRVEGHRQSDEDEGQTFADKMGEPVLPDLLDIYDDPRVARAADRDLMGHYHVDDQAVAAQRASIIDDGIFKGFLMSREPVKGAAHSNGHGRRQVGKHVVARQGVLIAQPNRTVSRQKLKEMLIAEVEAQDKPYGLRFVRVQGGYTLTGRALPQSFKVLPILVYRVYPDGREELVRGVSLEGTPLTALSEIQAAADDVQVFNGVCGAESGRVPVSSVSSTLLVRRVETARARKGAERPPLLAAPTDEPEADHADSDQADSDQASGEEL